MNAKFWSTAIIVVAIMGAMAGIIAYDESNNDDSGSNNVYNILARVNTEGSGIYIDKDDVESTVRTTFTATVDGSEVTYSVDVPYRNSTPFFTPSADSEGNLVYSVSSDNAAAWGGLICGTPGNTSIQHVQMNQIITSMGLSFVLYESGTSVSSSQVAYISTFTNASKIMNDSPRPDIGIIWEPQYSAVIDAEGTEFQGLGLTNYFFPGHTCCVLAGYSSYVNGHQDVTERFLAGYIESVNWVNAALSGTSPDDYDALVSTCVSSTGLDETYIKDALSNITYVYADEDGSLTQLKYDIADIVEANSSSLRYSMSDLGFSNPVQFANRFVDESYLHEAESYGSYNGTSTTVTVAVISGDIHQIALQVGVAQGFFTHYGINVQQVNESNGAGVAVAMQNGSANFGFMGAPPATITCVNGQLVTV